MFRPQLQSQPSTSSQQDQQFNHNNIQNFKNPQTFQNRPPNNKQANYPNKNYSSYQNLQTNTNNYRFFHTTQPQTFTQYPISQQIPLLRQSVFHHNIAKNSVSTVPPLTSPPSLTSQSQEQNFSQLFSQQSQE